jgi:hypothetical protein
MRHTLNSNKPVASKAQTNRIDRAAILDCIAEVVPKRGVIVQRIDHRHNWAQSELENSWNNAISYGILNGCFVDGKSPELVVVIWGRFLRDQCDRITLVFSGYRQNIKI